MKRVLTSMTVWALVLAFSPVWVTGCSVDASDQKEATGTLDLGLTGTSASGRTYRLRNGTIKISGTAAATVLTEEHLAATSVALELKAGAYLAKLNTGWNLERGTPDPMTGEIVFQNVTAALVSANPLPFIVSDQLTTQVRFQFNAGDEVVQLGNGRVVIGFDVNDCIGSEAAFCDADGDGFPPGEDCNDQNPEVFPGAPDFCDGLDNNCDGVIDEFCGCPVGDPACDNDGDGWPSDIDCNDFDPFINPGQPEFCDMLDNNCNGIVDEGCGGCDPADPNCDNDADGFPAGLDCNDFDPSVNPAQPESCDGQDNDCDGLIDDGCGVPNCSVVPQSGCGPGQSCYLLSLDGVTECLPSGNLPPGSTCGGSLNECSAPAVCASNDGGIIFRCFELCDVTSPSCSLPGETCGGISLDNLGICQ